MVGKKGYIKTLEAVIAVLIILLSSYALLPKNKEIASSVPNIVESAEAYAIEEISINSTIRNNIIIGNCTSKKEIESVINSPQNRPFRGLYDYTCLICSEIGTSSCVANTPADRAVYMTDIFISSPAIPFTQTVTSSPKVVRLWFWKKPTTAADITTYKINPYNACNYTEICY